MINFENRNPSRSDVKVGTVLIEELEANCCLYPNQESDKYLCLEMRKMGFAGAQRLPKCDLLRMHVGSSFVELHNCRRYLKYVEKHQQQI
jgi:hypothetical protein